MSETILDRAWWIAFFAVAYVVLYHLSGLFVPNDWIAGSVSLLFLPAFIRLLGYLVIGLWVMPALLLANLILVLTGGFDLGAGDWPELGISFATAMGAPLATHLAATAMQLKPSLESTSPGQLLALSVASAFGNTVVLGSALWLHTPQLINTVVFAPIFIGDMIGTWLVIYTLKFLFEAYLRSRQS